MKTCIEWRKSFKYFDQVDEYNIEYKPNKNEKLLDFLEHYAKKKRVNIYTEPIESNIEVLIAIQQTEKYNTAIVINDSPPKLDKNIQKLLIDNQCTYYFHCLCPTWDGFNQMLELKVSDIFISGELGFDLKRARARVGKTVQLRSYVNLSQTHFGDTFRGFFIRPEDIDTYSEYIDVFEFYDSVNKQNILYDIYFYDKHWDGNLREIIKNLDVDVNNYYLLGSEFANRRMNCKRDCFKGDKCNLCTRLKELADTLENSKDYDVFLRRYNKDGEGSES